MPGTNDTKEKNRHLTLVVDRDDHGNRLDRYLARFIPEHSRSYLQKRIKEGHVLVDGNTATAGDIVDTGSRIDIFIPGPSSPTIDPEDIAISIVYEDKYLAVVDKDAGISVHPGAGRTSGTLVSALLFHGMTLSSKAGTDRPGIVHRLDKDTSGLLVVAKDDRAYDGLRAQFSAHTVERRYRGICWGRISKDHETVESPIGRHRIDRKRMTTKVEAGRPAVTEFFVVSRFPSMTLAEFRLHTGRTHQIRVQMASIGHPIVGDRTYGSMRAVRSVEDRRLRDAVTGLGRQALHAVLLGFVHPITGETMRFESPIPADIQKIVEVLSDEG